MPRLDKFHEAVKNALIKDGWTITDDPFTIDFEDAHYLPISPLRERLPLKKKMIKLPSR